MPPSDEGSNPSKLFLGLVLCTCSQCTPVLAPQWYWFVELPSSARARSVKQNELVVISAFLLFGELLREGK